MPGVSLSLCAEQGPSALVIDRPACGLRTVWLSLAHHLENDQAYSACVQDRKRLLRNGVLSLPSALLLLCLASAYKVLHQAAIVATIDRFTNHFACGIDGEVDN